jgi:hypothetical protein|nr:MAG TPA: hypothetical protein [Caudoviricetes sp.]
MFKQLVQLFAEKFLVSKKEWVAQQSLPSSTWKTTVSISSESFGANWVVITAPYDGIFCLVANTDAILVQNYAGAWSGQQGSRGYSGAHVVCAKGCTVAYQLGAETIASSVVCFFAPSNGSST